MAKYIRPKSLEKKTVTRHFAMQWSTSARVDFYLLERQTRACSCTHLTQRSMQVVDSLDLDPAKTGVRKRSMCSADRVASILTKSTSTDGNGLRNGLSTLKVPCSY